MSDKEKRHNEEQNETRSDSHVYEAMRSGENLHDAVSGAKIKPVASGSTKDATIGSGKYPDQDPEPFEDQQDPRRPIGQHEDKGRPPLMKK